MYLDGHDALVEGVPGDSPHPGRRFVPGPLPAPALGQGLLAHPEQAECLLSPPGAAQSPSGADLKILSSV